MDADNKPAPLLTKRKSEEAVVTAQSATKRARVDANPSINRNNLASFTQVLDLDRVMQILLQDLPATDKFFQQHPEDADRVATMLQRLGSQPVTLAMLEPDAQLPLKRFIAIIAQRKWLDLDELGGKLYLLPLFVTPSDDDDIFGSYRNFLCDEAAAALPGYLDLEFEEFTAVEAALATNNLPLLEWCRALRGRLNEAVFSDLYWELENNHSGRFAIWKLALEPTRAWWVTNVGEFPDDGDDEEDEDIN